MHARILVIFLLCAVTTACGEADRPSDAARTKITVGVLPDQDPAAVQRRFDPLIGYLQEATGFDLDLIAHDSYKALTDGFADRSVDLAWLGGLTFVIAERESNAQALVMRDVDTRFTSNYIARSDVPGESVLNFEGKSFAFGSRLSTSGHLMPRHFLAQRGIVPETFFSDVQYTAGHDETALLVRNGEIDLGVVNHVILNSMTTDGRVGANELKVVETTPTYSNYVWAVQHDMDPSLQIALRNAFLALNPVDPDHQKILRSQGAQGYLPAMAKDFDDTRAAAQGAGLLGTAK